MTELLDKLEEALATGYPVGLTAHHYWQYDMIQIRVRGGRKFGDIDGMEMCTNRDRWTRVWNQLVQGVSI